MTVTAPSQEGPPPLQFRLATRPLPAGLTLAQVMADAEVRVSRSGSALVAALDRLTPPSEVPSGRHAARGLHRFSRRADGHGLFNLGRNRL